MADPPPGRDIRDGTRGEGAPAWRCIVKSRLTGAPTRRLKVSIPRFFSLQGAPVVVPEGWRRRPPGRSGPFPPKRLSLAGPDRRGRRSLPTCSRRSRARPLGGRDGHDYQIKFLLSRKKSRSLLPLPARGERVGVRGSWAGRGASAPHPTRSSRVDLSPPLAGRGGALSGVSSAEEGERAPHCPPIGVGVHAGYACRVPRPRLRLVGG
jgi:hypothetical protein